MTVAIRLSVACAVGITLLSAQEHLGKQCTPAPDVDATFKKLDAQRDSTPFSQRVQQEREALEALRHEYPDDLWLHRRYVNLIRDEFADEWPALRQSYVEAEAASPDDAVRAYLAGWVREGLDTPYTIRQLERANRLDPDLAFPYLTLSTNYSRGRWADSAKAEQNLLEYFRNCPGTSYNYAYSMLARTAPQEAQREVAEGLRDRLESSSDPEELTLFEHAWSLEFRSTPPSEHTALRKQIATDLARLESLDIQPDPQWLELLANGYKQTNNAAELIKTEDRLLTEFPHSPQAFRLRIERERKEHPAPGRDATEQERDEWNAAALARRQGWIESYGPDSLLLQIVLSNYEALKTLTPEQAHYVKTTIIDPILERFGPQHFLLGRFIQFYFKHNLDPKQAAEWADTAYDGAKRDMAQRLQVDYLNDVELEKLERSTKSVILRNLGLRLEAHRRLGDEEATRELREEVATVESGHAGEEFQIWALKAKLAEIEDLKADALAYYQHALNVRPPQPGRGADGVTDPLLADAKRLWNELGGTEEAWETWRNTAKPPRELVEGRWEQPGKPLEPFDLADLTGRTWRLKALEGKTLFLNLWATWCGPCQGELPHVQKLYEKLKDRPEFELLTLNMDQELGLVQPYIDEKRFTFPVLPAYRYVNSVFDTLGIGIPQNWIIDGEGIWRWQQLGYSPGTEDWLGDMLEKLNATAKK